LDSPLWRLTTVPSENIKSNLTSEEDVPSTSLISYITLNGTSLPKISGPSKLYSGTISLWGEMICWSAEAVKAAVQIIFRSTNVIIVVTADL
jgi:hypothetical protein